MRWALVVGVGICLVGLLGCKRQIDLDAGQKYIWVNNDCGDWVTRSRWR